MCEAPFGPFRQNIPGPFFVAGFRQHDTRSCLPDAFLAPLAKDDWRVLRAFHLEDLRERCKSDPGAVVASILKQVGRNFVAHLFEDVCRLLRFEATDQLGRRAAAWSSRATTRSARCTSRASSPRGATHGRRC